MTFWLRRCHAPSCPPLGWTRAELHMSEMLATLQESKEATNFYFCYRWLLILFKREFSSYEEVKYS